MKTAPFIVLSLNKKLIEILNSSLSSAIYTITPSRTAIQSDKDTFESLEALLTRKINSEEQKTVPNTKLPIQTLISSYSLPISTPQKDHKITILSAKILLCCLYEIRNASA